MKRLQWGRSRTTAETWPACGSRTPAPGGTAIASATIDRILQQETITATLTVEPTSFTAGQSIMLSWKTTNATSGVKC